MTKTKESGEPSFHQLQRLPPRPRTREAHCPAEPTHCRERPERTHRREAARATRETVGGEENEAEEAVGGTMWSGFFCCFLWCVCVCVFLFLSCFCVA